MNNACSPWYCSSLKHEESGEDMLDSYEDIFYQYGVNLVISGHVHVSIVQYYV